MPSYWGAVNNDCRHRDVSQKRPVVGETHSLAAILNAFCRGSSALSVVAHALPTDGASARTASQTSSCVRWVGRVSNSHLLLA